MKTRRLTGATESDRRKMSSCTASLSVSLLRSLIHAQYDVNTFRCQWVPGSVLSTRLFFIIAPPPGRLRGPIALTFTHLSRWHVSLFVLALPARARTHAQRSLPRPAGKREPAVLDSEPFALLSLFLVRFVSRARTRTRNTYVRHRHTRAEAREHEHTNTHTERREREHRLKQRLNTTDPTE